MSNKTLEAGPPIGHAKDRSICDGPRVIARVMSYGHTTNKIWTEESERFALLFAAAPDLLAAARAALAVGIHSLGIDEKGKEAEIMLRDAVVKAKGGG